MDKSTPPVLELSNFSLIKFERGDELVKEEIKENLKKCCEEHGFFTISDYGIRELLIKEALGISKDFFDLPLQQKKQCFKINSFGIDRGYQERQFEVMSGFAESAIPDANELFMLGKDLSYSDSCKIAQLESVCLEEIYLENIFPNSLPQMRKILNTLYECMYNLSLRLHSLLQYALDIKLPELSKISSELGLSYYPKITNHIKENQWRIGAHEDHDMFTILLPCREEGKIEDPHGRGGLELLYKNEYHRVLYKNSDLIINCGHTLRHISGDKYKSALHRIPMPKPSKLHDNTRYSISYNAYAIFKYHQHSLRELQRLINKGNSVI
jgi:isopenicillin N synthase-like dioxygenase